MRDQTKDTEAPANCPPKGSNSKSKPPSQVGQPKTEVLRNLISRPTGATIEQIQKHFNWQPHTVRTAISRLRKSGVTIELDRSDKVTCYRLLPTGALK